MSNYGMTVEDVGACVRLVDVMTRNLPALGIERGHFDALYIETDKATGVRRRLDDGSTEPLGPSRRRYTLLLSGIPDSAIPDLERLAGTQLKQLSEKPPAGQTISINELLESILLVREPRPTAANGLVLALLGTDPDRVDLARWHIELSRFGCRGVRIGCVATEGTEFRVLYLVEIARPPPNFVPPVEWEDNRVVAFYRVKPEVSCPFYIEWGYTHPVRELARLYQLSDERLVLMAADAVDLRRGRAGEPQTRVSLKLRSNDWQSIFEMPDQAEYGIELATELELQTLEAPRRPMNVRMPVDVRSRPLIGSGSAEVEHKIAWHQQAIEQLHRARQHSEIERQEPVYLVRVFEQSLDYFVDDSSQALPAGFARFLDRPYSELGGFQYGFFEDPFRPGTWLHIVLDERPGGYERVAADMVSDAYVCPQRWWDSGVRLFVRATDTLHPYIEDEALLLRLRDELWGRGDLGHEHPLLLRRSPDGAGAAQAICLSRLAHLLAPGVFQLLSARFDVRVPEFHLGTRDDMLAAQQASVRTLNDLAGTLETGVEAAIADRVDIIEAAWKNADARVFETETRLAGHVASASEINALLDRHGTSWQEFVSSVLEADRGLSLRKVEALGKYAAAHDEHAKTIKLFERGLTDLNDRLERDKQEIAAQRTLLRQREDRLVGLEHELPEAIASLDNFETQLRTRLDEFDARQCRRLDEVRSKVNAAVEKVRDLQQAQKAIDDEHERAEGLHWVELREIEELRTLRERFEAQGKAWDAEKAKRMPPLDDEFLDWLEKELRSRTGKSDGRIPKILSWLIGRRRP